MAVRGNRSINAAAAKVGATLGRIAAKVDAMKRERAALVAELDHVIQVAQKMKADIGDVNRDVARAKGKVSKAVRKAKRRMSPEARARIAAAARKRWAAYRKAKGT
jgi:uncharacterized protein YoxC